MAELRFAEGLGCAEPDPQPFAVSMQLPDSQIIPDTLACDIIYA